MVFKQLLIIPYIPDDVFYLYLLDLLDQNDFQLSAIYHILSDLSGSIVLEVSKYTDPIIFMGN